MEHELDVILSLTGGLSAALLMGLLALWLGLSPVVGYLLAGVIVGPFTPGFVAQQGITAQFAEIGVILLMFGVGLRFRLEELLAVRKVALPGAILQMAVTTAIVLPVMRLFGFSLGGAALIGVAVSVASTVVLLRVLEERGVLETPAGHLAVGWLVVEDLVTVFALVLLPAIAHASRGAPGSAGASSVSSASGAAPVFAWLIAIALVKVAVFVAGMLIVGRRVIPWLLARVERTRSRELFTLAVLVLALGLALASAEIFGASMALGAFLAGMAVGQSELSARAATDALPMRDAFAVMFFVSTGMLFDPRAVLARPALLLTVLALVLVAKPVVAFCLSRLLGQSRETASTLAASLAQIGEFSFILATVARGLGLLPGEALQPLVAVAIVSIAVNPSLLRLAAASTARRGARAA